MSKIMHMDTQYAGVTPEKDFSDLIDFFYPVGCYFHTSSSSFDPNVEWGGSWTLLGEGTVLLSGSSSGSYIVGNTYGDNSKSYTPSGSVSVTVGNHTIDGNELTYHSHGSGVDGTTILAASDAIARKAASGSGTANTYYGNSAIQRAGVAAAGGSWAHSHGGSGSFTGTASSINVMQKSEATYIWHRTA